MNKSVQTLSPAEKKFFKRQVNSVNIFLYSCAANIIVAIALTISMLYEQDSFDKTRLVLVIVLLLAARGHLKQHKNAKLLIKFADLLGKKDERQFE